MSNRMYLPVLAVALGNSENKDKKYGKGPKEAWEAGPSTLLLTRQYEYILKMKISTLKPNIAEFP